MDVSSTDVVDLVRRFWTPLAVLQDGPATVTVPPQDALADDRPVGRQTRSSIGALPTWHPSSFVKGCPAIVLALGELPATSATWTHDGRRMTRGCLRGKPDRLVPISPPHLPHWEDWRRADRACVLLLTSTKSWWAQRFVRVLFQTFSTFFRGARTPSGGDLQATSSAASS